MTRNKLEKLEQALYDRLRNAAGIAYNNQNITLRFYDDKGDFIVANLVVVDIINQTEEDKKCWSCGENPGKYEVDLSVGGCCEPHVSKVMLCYDCYCPK